MTPRPLKPDTWRGTTRKALGDSLSLPEVVILRRLRDRQLQKDIAQACGFTKNSVSSRLHYLRGRFGVSTNDELLALPRVIEQLDAGKEAQS